MTDATEPKEPAALSDTSVRMKLKPSFPLVGDYGIGLHDEITLELRLPGEAEPARA